ncbi:MAG: membrane or secreted protein [Planctomycetota bacterium]
MSRMSTAIKLIICLSLFSCAGCGQRPGWGFSWGQGTTERQKARATVHDPFPLNDIGPEVVGGRPREYFNPQPEAVRHQVTRP